MQSIRIRPPNLHIRGLFPRYRGGEAGFDQNEVPDNLLANEPSLSTQEAGGNRGS
jgi:hypothetical protein